MIRVTKLADYAILLMTWFAHRQAREGGAGARHTAPALAADTGLPLPTVSKLLRQLGKAGLLTSQRGASGGYSLAREPREITVADLITAVEGPIALMDCLSDASPDCDVEPLCPTRTNWNRINEAIRGALASISLEEMARPQGGWSERLGTAPAVPAGPGSGPQTSPRSERSNA